LPIITTETGGSKELISGNGVIVKKTSVGDLREALANYSDNPSLIKSHGKKSRGIAEKMGWNRVAQQYLGVYKKCAV
jgi:glycosyltransferase involved in cell wall biosynthesis